jgi:hypothetical protein
MKLLAVLFASIIISWVSSAELSYNDIKVKVEALINQEKNFSKKAKEESKTIQNEITKYYKEISQQISNLKNRTSESLKKENSIKQSVVQIKSEKVVLKNKLIIDESLLFEINNMAASSIPKETIIEHVNTHFPDKQVHEVNDIVISALASSNKIKQVNKLDTVKANKDAIILEKKKYKKSKR